MKNLSLFYLGVVLIGIPTSLSANTKVYIIIFNNNNNNI